MASFADLLRQHRAATGLTQEELAERAGLSARAISDLERGVRQRPYTHTLRRLAQALNLDEGQTASLQRAARSGGEAAVALEDSAEVVKDRISLPLQPTPFIGRQQEVEEVSSFLGREEVRLLTLTGPGGVGKTRLALRVAEEVAPRFSDGVVFVSLASLADPALVPATIASAFGFREGGGQPILEALVEYLRPRRILLVLDNFEHLLEAAGVVSHLLSVCPQLTLLVTSRATLRLSAEHEYPVSPLAVPVSGHLPELGVLSRYDAIQLFVQRAQAVKPGFGLTEQNASPVAEICSRLDGLPLAIELAAARIRLLPPHALLNRLGNRLELLTGGARDAPTRHQTLRSAIDWSYSILTPEEQALFARLSVFAGGCSLEAAEAVCRVDEDAVVFEGLSSLVDFSLLRVEEGVGGEPRFLMLETIREYAKEKLEESGEGETVARRHAEHYVSLAERLDADFNSTRWIRSSATYGPRMINAERDNFAAARAWLREQGEMVLGLRLMGALGPWRLSPDPGQARTAWLEGFEPYLDSAPPLLRAKILLWKGGWCQSEEHVRWLEEAVALYREAGGELLLLRGLIVAASRMAYQPSYFPLRTVRLEKAERLFGESLALARRLGSKPGEGGSLRGLANCAWRARKDRTRAQALFEESLAVEREVDNLSGIADTVWVLGVFAVEDGDLARAAALFDEAMACYRTLGIEERAHHLHFLSAVLALKQGSYAAIVSRFQDILASNRGGRLAEREVALLNVAWLLLLASSAAAQAHALRAARLFGAVHAAWGDSCYYPVAGDWMGLFESYRSAARAQLDEAAWATAWEEGRAMTTEQAVSYALQEGADTLMLAGQLQPEHDGRPL